MKFYTIEFNDKQYVAVEKDDKMLVTLESIGIGVSDMNDLICRYDELHALIKRGLEADVKELDPVAYVIKAPIPVPGQDIIWRSDIYFRRLYTRRH